MLRAMMPSIPVNSDLGSSISKSPPLRRAATEPNLQDPKLVVQHKNSAKEAAMTSTVEEVEAHLKRALTPSAPSRAIASLKKLRFGNSSSSALSLMTDSECDTTISQPVVDNPFKVLDAMNAGGVFDMPSVVGTPTIPTKSEPPLLTPRSGRLDASASLGTSTQDLAGALESSFEDLNAYDEDGIAGPWSLDKLVRVLTNDVDDLCMANENISHSEEPASNVRDELRIFFSQYKQPFEMGFYVERLVQFANCSTAAFISALVYLDRVNARCPSLALTEMNCHRLLSTALVLAIKYLDDEVYGNVYYARVSGLTTNELNTLEKVMLSLLDWRLSIDPAVFVRYEHSLLKASAALEGDALPSTPEPDS